MFSDVKRTRSLRLQRLLLRGRKLTNLELNETTEVNQLIKSVTGRIEFGVRQGLALLKDCALITWSGVGGWQMGEICRKT